MKRHLLSTLIALLLPLLATAQEIIVRDFTDITVQNAIQTTGDWPMTNESEPASKIIVQVQYKDQLSFGGRVLIDENTQQPMVQHLGSEYTVFMAPRSQSITVKIPGFNDKRIDVRQYVKDGLLPRRLYRLRLTVIPKSVVAGRNFSWGISGGYLMPMMTQTADGYCGSLINYGNGTATEDASYKDAQGYVAGINMDIRLRKNWYLNIGANFGQYRYRNNFNGQLTGYGYRKDLDAPNNPPREQYGQYHESYLHSYVEVPLYISYRFPTSRRTNLQIGVGPSFSYGIESKMKFIGSAIAKGGGELLAGGDLRCQQQWGEFDLYSKVMTYTKKEIFNPSGAIIEPRTVSFDKSPLNRLGVSAGAYIAYELYGFSLSVHYQYMLTNMANDGYWNNRLAVNNSQENYMSGCKLRHNFLQFKLGYTLRY